MAMLHVSFAKSTYKSMTRRKTKKMHFYVPDFVTEKSLNKFQRSSTVKMSSCSTNFQEMTSEGHEATIKENRQRLMKIIKSSIPWSTRLSIEK